MALQCFDVAAMLLEMIDRGLTLDQISKRVDADLSRKLLKHYMKGGVPNLPRGLAIMELWLEVTNRNLSEAPTLRWSPRHRTEYNRVQDESPRWMAPVEQVVLRPWPPERISRHYCFDD